MVLRWLKVFFGKKTVSKTLNSKDELDLACPSCTGKLFSVKG